MYVGEIPVKADVYTFDDIAVKLRKEENEFRELNAIFSVR